MLLILSGISQTYASPVPPPAGHLVLRTLRLVQCAMGRARHARLAPVAQEPALHAPLTSLAMAARRERRMPGVERQRSENRLANAW